jgi:hypothetical protein
MREPFAALHESGSGTKRTSGNVRPVSAFRGEADIPPQGRDFRFRPIRDIGRALRQGILMPVFAPIKLLV